MTKQISVARALFVARINTLLSKFLSLVSCVFLCHAVYNDLPPSHIVCISKMTHAVNSCYKVITFPSGIITLREWSMVVKRLTILLLGHIHSCLMKSTQKPTIDDQWNLFQHRGNQSYNMKAAGIIKLALPLNSNRRTMRRMYRVYQCVIRGSVLEV